ncbi:MAG: hypothetical protein J6Y94_07615, partial [Bacteriovoracaceae bacterium]|nr:hypothetical protein [Bacteriovoracaceae bacterium]
KCNQIKKGMQTFFDSKTILALAEKETSMSPRQNVHPSILYTGSRIKLDNNQDNQEDVREAYLRQLEMACGGKFHQGYITEEETMTTFEVNNPGAPSAIIFSN